MTKKAISALLAVCLLFSLAIPVFAEEADTSAEATLTVGSITAAPGDTLTVPVAIRNNPGLSAIVFTVKYDTTAMTLTEISNNGLFAKMTTGTNVLLMNDTDVTSDGIMVYLKFSVNANAALGDYTVETLVRETSNADLEAPAVLGAVGTVTLAAPSSEITDASVTLGTDITVNYYAKLTGAHTGAQMKFTLGNTSTLVDGVATDVSGEYLFAYKGLAPQCLGDSIKAELILDGEVLDTYADYSVLKYCQYLLSSSAATLGMSAEKHDAMLTLVADLLEYGAAAQLYRGYRLGALVNEGITGQTEFVELDSSYAPYVDESGLADVYMISAGVYFDYTNSLYLKFTAPELAEGDCYVLFYNDVTGTEIEYALSDCTLIDEASSTYLLVMDPTSATHFEDLCYVELYAPNSRGRVVLQQALEYSIASYVYSMQNKLDENNELSAMAKLARATYNYGASASAYNAIAN